MPNQFCPGHVDYEGAMAREFNAARAVSHHGAAVWRSAFEPYLKGANRILDVGAGTGRFAVLIAQWFGTAVTGIEPASGMRKIAVIDGQHPTVSYVGARAEPASIRTKLVWCCSSLKRLLPCLQSPFLR